MLNNEQRQRVRETAREFRERLDDVILHSNDPKRVKGAQQLAEAGMRGVLAMREDFPNPPDTDLTLGFLAVLHDIEFGGDAETTAGARLLGILFEWEYRPGTLTLAAVTNYGRSAWVDYLMCQAPRLKHFYEED